MNKVKVEEVTELTVAYFIATFENGKHTLTKVFLYKDLPRLGNREEQLAKAMDWAKQMEENGQTRTLIYETK